MIWVLSLIIYQAIEIWGVLHSSVFFWFFVFFFVFLGFFLPIYFFYLMMALWSLHQVFKLLNIYQLHSKKCTCRHFECLHFENRTVWDSRHLVSTENLCIISSLVSTSC
jgi:hypothetical protein